MKKFLSNLSSSAIAGWGLFGRKIMNFVQFLTYGVPFLALGAMLFFCSKKSKKLKQEKDMFFFLISQLNEEMEKLQLGNTIHIEIDPKSFSTICLAEHNGGVAPGKDLIRIRAVFTRHLGIKLTP